MSIPLADYANLLMGWYDYNNANQVTTADGVPLPRHKDYPKARDAIWRQVSNLVTVNSNSVVANIRIQVGYDAVKYPNGKFRWYYVAAIDRSNLRHDGRRAGGDPVRRDQVGAGLRKVRLLS